MIGFLGRPELDMNFPRPSVQTMFHDCTQQGLSINTIARRPRMRNGGWSNQASAQQSRAVLYSPFPSNERHFQLGMSGCECKPAAKRKRDSAQLQEGSAIRRKALIAQVPCTQVV